MNSVCCIPISWHGAYQNIWEINSLEVTENDFDLKLKMCLCIGPSLHVEEVIAENLSDLRETVSDVCWQQDYKLYFWTWTMRSSFILLSESACVTATAPVTDKLRYVLGASRKQYVKPLVFSQNGGKKPSSEFYLQIVLSSSFSAAVPSKNFFKNKQKTWTPPLLSFLLALKAELFNLPCTPPLKSRPYLSKCYLC